MRENRHGLFPNCLITLQVYLPMGYCYAHRIKAEPTQLIQKLRDVRQTLRLLL